MNNQFYSPSFIIDPKKKDIVLTEWHVGDVKFNSRVWLSGSFNNKMLLEFEVKAICSEKTSLNRFIVGLQIYENAVYYSSQRLLNTFDSFVGGMAFDHTVPRKCQFYVLKYKDALPNQNKSMKSTGINHQSTDGYIEKLWREKLFTDFIFKVKNQEFAVHKSILAAQSEVFRVMFTYERKVQYNTAVLTDISPVAFQQFLEYLYIRKLPKYSNYTTDLYKAAHKYDIKELMELCESLIAPKVCQDNAVDMLEFANTFDIKEIKESAFNIIQNEIFPEKPLPLNLKHNVKLVKKIIKAKMVFENTLSDVVTQSSK